MRLSRLVIFAISIMFTTNVLAKQAVWKTLEGQSIDLTEGYHELIFLDALCPMPHFPNCEQVLALLADNSLSVGGEPILVFNTLYADVGSIEQFITKHKLTHPAVVDADLRLHNRYEIYSTPYRIVLDDGEVRNRGPINLAQENAQ